MRQFLRRTVIALRLLSKVQSLCATLRPQAEPLLVGLAKGLVAKEVIKEFKVVVGLLHKDGDLELSSALVLLLSTAIETIVRFREYMRWPYYAYKLCREFNLDRWLLECANFLDLSPDHLDTGFGCLLQQLCARASPARRHR